MTRITDYDLTTFVLALLLLGILIVASVLIMQPFVPALIWAATIVISSWSLLLKVQRCLRGSRTLAVVVMTTSLVVVLMIPLTIAVTAIVENIDEAAAMVQSVVTRGAPPPPELLTDVPVVGPRLADSWREFSTISKDEFMARLQPYLGDALRWLASQLGGFGRLVLHLLLTIVLSALLYSKGEVAGRGVIAFARRLADDRGEHAVMLAMSATSAVASGVVITALIQGVLAGLGLLITGVPYAIVLGSIAFLLSVVQIGAWPVMIGAVSWLFYSDREVAAWSLAVWSVVVLVSDNFIRPFLIRRGADIPLILIFAGVIGGLISFGVIGLFVGPVVLAVTYTLLQAWVDGTAPVKPGA